MVNLLKAPRIPLASSPGYTCCLAHPERGKKIQKKWSENRQIDGVQGPFSI